MEKIVTTKCAYLNCASRKDKNPNKLKFYYFPVNNRNRCISWLNNSGNDPSLIDNDSLKNYVICENHFSEKSFINQTHHRLTHDALPISCISNDSDSPDELHVLKSEDQETYSRRKRICFNLPRGRFT